MTDEEIIKRAKDAEKRTGFGELVHSPISKGINSAYGIGFIEGMVEYRNSMQEESVSIWHDSNEKADIHKGSIVAINSIGEAAAFNQGSTAIYFMDDYDIEQWAYVNDLLKV